MITKNIHRLPAPVNGVIIYDASISSLKRKKDRNNCVPRAIAVALDLPIDEVEVERSWGKGTSKKESDRFAKAHGFQVVFAARGSLHGLSPIKPISIEEACRRFSQGRFIIKSRRHWFTIIDGVPVDSWDWLNERSTYESFSQPGEMISLRGWDHKAWKIWSVPVKG